MKLASLWLALFITGCGFGYAFTPQKFGQALPSATAVFETSLQSAITSSATTMTLTANAVRGGGALSGYNCFTVDEGSAQAETICGTVSGTTVSSLTRGISQSTGTTTVAALQFAHRRGANVKITDFPLIQILKAQANGEDTYPNGLRFDSIAAYTSAPTFTDQSNQLVSYKAAQDYANNVIQGGAPTSTETLGGKVRLATQIQMASSTDLGVTAPLALQAKYATSSPGYAGLWAVITNNAGKIAHAFLDLTDSFTFSGGLLSTASSTLSSTTTIAASNASTTALVLNGVPYSFPTANGASTTALCNNGYGRLNWCKQDFALIAGTTTTGAFSTTTLTGIPASTDLKVVIDTGAVSGAISTYLQFNADVAGTNYTWRNVDNVTPAVTSGGHVGLIRTSAAVSNEGEVIQVSISNATSKIKTVVGQSIHEGVDDATGASIWGSWNNTSAQISSISLGCAPTACPVGTTIRVYGSNQ